MFLKHPSWVRLCKVFSHNPDKEFSFSRITFRRKPTWDSRRHLHSCSFLYWPSYLPKPLILPNIVGTKPIPVQCNFIFISSSNRTASSARIYPGTSSLSCLSYSPKLIVNSTGYRNCNNHVQILAHFLMSDKCSQIVSILLS